MPIEQIATRPTNVKDLVIPQTQEQEESVISYPLKFHHAGGIRTWRGMDMKPFLDAFDSRRKNGQEYIIDIFRSALEFRIIGQNLHMTKDEWDRLDREIDVIRESVAQGIESATFLTLAENVRSIMSADQVILREVVGNDPFSQGRVIVSAINLPKEKDQQVPMPKVREF